MINEDLNRCLFFVLRDDVLVAFGHLSRCSNVNHSTRPCSSSHTHLMPFSWSFLFIYREVRMPVCLFFYDSFMPTVRMHTRTHHEHTRTAECATRFQVSRVSILTLCLALQSSNSLPRPSEIPRYPHPAFSLCIIIHPQVLPTPLPSQPAYPSPPHPLPSTLINPNNNLPPQRPGLPNSTSKTTPPPSTDNSIPPPLGTEGPHQDFHIGSKLPASRLVMHLLAGCLEPAARSRCCGRRRVWEIRLERGRPGSDG